MSHLLDDTYGVCLIGVLLSAELHGVALVQAWYYYTHQNDGWPLKLFVAAVLCFDTIHQALITHAIYTYLIANFGNVPELNNIVWSMVVEVLFNGLTALLVQSFLVIRIWRLSKGNKLLTGAAWLLVLGGFGCVVAYVGKAMPLQTYTDLKQIKGISLAINITGASGDVLIATILCYLLLGSRTGFSRSDTMINKLVLFFVNTGLITSLFALASLISITAAPNAFIYILFFFCMGRLYSNSLLAILNGRHIIKEASGNGILTTGDMPLSLRGHQHGTAGTYNSGPALEIKIATSQENDTMVGDIKRASG